MYSKKRIDEEAERETEALYRNLIIHVELSYYAHRTTQELRSLAVDAVVAMFLENRSKSNV